MGAGLPGPSVAGLASSFVSPPPVWALYQVGQVTMWVRSGQNCLVLIAPAREARYPK